MPISSFLIIQYFYVNYALFTLIYLLITVMISSKKREDINLWREIDTSFIILYGDTHFHPKTYYSLTSVSIRGIEYRILLISNINF